MITGDVDIREFQEFTRQAIKKIEDPRLKRIALRGYALKFLQRVIPDTPVKTGRARAAWTAASGKLPGVNAIKIGGNDHGEQLRGRTEGQYKESTRSTNPASWSIEIFNGAPHITYLELGASNQAPSGMVRINLREMATKDIAHGERRRIEKAMRVANIKARRTHGLRQGKMKRNAMGRANLRRR